MAIENALKIAVSIKLDDGTNPSGSTKTVSVSLGTLDKDAWDNDKAFAIVEALSPAFEKTIDSVIKTETAQLISD